MKKIFLFSLVICAISCSKEPQGNGDYIIFGHFYGECFGEACIEVFKLDSEKLTEDINDFYPNSNFYDGAFETPLSQEKFEIAEILWETFPDNLLNESETTLGQPDAGDWGGLYVEYKKGDVRDFWLIDQTAENIPSYLIPFQKRVNDVIREINN